MGGMNKYRLLKPILIVMMLLASAHIVSANDTDVDGTDDANDDFPNDPCADTDTDSDGMPDEWELRFNPKKDLSFRSNEDLDVDGYTNIEEYLNQTNPATRNNSTVDTIDKRIGN